MENQIVTTAVINISPESDLIVLQLLCEANKLRDYAEKRVIAMDADLKPAVDDLTLIAKVKKALIEKKAEYVKPIKVHLDAFNDTFMTLLTPLEDADHITRSKILSYREAQERKAKEAAEINRQKEELARREAAFNGTGEVTIDTTPVTVPPPPPAHVRTEVGTLGTQQNWKFEVVDFALLPNEYKMADEVKIGKVVRATKGSVAIPGVKMWPEDSLRINTR